MSAITKAAFVADLAEAHNMNRQTAQEAVNAVVATLKQTLIDGHDIKLPGLGTFSLKDRAARTGRNPATGESLEIPTKRTVQFKVASDLQRQIPQPE
jgi:DNA-binding protein HU-beta